MLANVMPAVDGLVKKRLLAQKKLKLNEVDPVHLSWIAEEIISLLTKQ